MKIKDKLDYSFNIIGNLGEFFRSAPTDVKIMLLGSIFPEKIQFDGKIIEPTTTTRCLTLSFREPTHYEGIKNWNPPQTKKIPTQYPRWESNPNRRNRNPKFYPLDYRGIILAVSRNQITKITNKWQNKNF